MMWFHEKELKMKKLFRVEEHRVLMVYAEDIEEAQLLFTENIDGDGQADAELMAMETDNYPDGWENAVPYGDEENDRTCDEIVENNKKQSVAKSVKEK